MNDAIVLPPKGVAGPGRCPQRGTRHSLATALGLAVLLCFTAAGQATAHGLSYAIEQGNAVSVRLSLDDGSVLAGERYELYRDGEDNPAQTGSTDDHGRVVFLPDRAGTWRLKVFAEDGHGKVFTIKTDAQGGVSEVEQPALALSTSLLVGLSVLFGIFGIVSLFTRKKETA